MIKTAASAALLFAFLSLPAYAAEPSPAIAQPAQGGVHWPVVKEGKTVKLTQHVYLIPDELVAMVPNVGIVVGSKATLVIDPGMGRLSGEAVAREVAKVVRGGDVYIVNTHFHPEHTTGDIAFPKARIVRAAAQQQDVDEMGMKWVATFASRSKELAQILEGATFRKADQMFEKETTLDLGGVRARVMRLGPGHTRGDTVVFVEGDAVLFSGDLAMKNLFPAFATPQSSSITWLTSLDEMERLNPRHVIGAHGLATDATVIGEYRELLKTLQARVSTLKREGKSAEDTAVQAREELAKKYPGWQQPIRAHTAAMVIYKELP